MISEYIEAMKSVPIEDRLRDINALGIGLQAMIGLPDFVSSSYNIYSDPMPVSIATALAGVAIMSYAHYRSSRETKDNPDLITKDIYSIVRHPNYAGRGLMSLGLLMQHPTPGNFAVGSLTIIALYATSKAEDSTLAESYGKKFEEYCAKVPGFIPYSNRVASKLKNGLNKAKKAIQRKK